MPLWSYLPSQMNVSFPPEGAKAPRLPAAAGIVQAPGISAGQDGQASGLVPEQPLPAKARRSIDMREIHVVQPVACRFELPVAAAAPRPRSAGTARAATRTAADVTDQDESAFVAQRTESDADRRPNDQSSSEMRRTRRRNCLPNCSCTRARTKCGACEPWNGSALHRDRRAGNRSNSTNCRHFMHRAVRNRALQAPFEWLPALHRVSATTRPRYALHWPPQAPLRAALCSRR